MGELGRMMKTSCLLRAPYSSSSLISSTLHRFCKPRNKFASQNHTLAYSSSASSSSSSSCSSSSSSSSFSAISSPPSSLSSNHEPKIPLFLRPPIYSATLSDVTNFFNWAKALTSSVGSSFEQIDNGPDATLLLRELKWFLDDAVEDPSLISHLGTPQNERFLSIEVGLRASLDQIYKLWKQRIEERRPLQYIVGCEHWRDLVLSVEEGVLIPRPETEKIVDLVEDVVGKCGVLKEGPWVDLGTGSGALAIGIARVLGKSGKVVAIELSPVAVAVAKYNVERYSLQDSIEVRQGSWFDPLMDLEGELAGIVSNPPYIPSKDINGLQAEVGKHEPGLALDGGVEGMDHLIYLCMKTSMMLKPGGFFAFETNGEKQCSLLAHYLEIEAGSNFRDVNIVADFAGNLRFVTGYRK